MVRRSDAPGWLLDEVASAGAENLDPGHVARYDDKEDAAGAEEVERCRRLGLGPTSTVVDLGAGTGQFTLAAAPACRRVVAVDPSPVMRRALAADVARAGLTNVDIVDAGFLTYEHTGPPADLVYSRFALHHLPDAWKVVALTRIRSLLRPDGWFRLWDVVYSFEPGTAEDAIEAWCATGGSDPSAGWARTEIEDHVRDEHSTYSWLLEAMIERTGFTVVEASYGDDRFSARYVLRPT